MPQPPLGDLTQRLLDLYVEAERTIVAEALETASDRRRARLTELRATVEAELARLRDASAEWATNELPAVWASGASSAGGFTWTVAHRHAIAEFIGRFWDDVVGLTDTLDKNARSWLLTEARRETALSLIEGRTAPQAARSLTRTLAVTEDAIGDLTFVTYKDGSRRRFADYADMLIRTNTANAYNAGTLTQLRELGIGWCEVFDGAGCGWTSHNDAEKANGRIVTLEEAGEQLLSHPRCRRSFGGRPDITSVEQAAEGSPSTTEEQRAAAAEMEQAREAAFAARRARQARAERAAARTPRTGRTGRTGRAASQPDP